MSSAHSESPPFVYLAAVAYFCLLRLNRMRQSLRSYTCSPVCPKCEFGAQAQIASCIPSHVQ